MDSRVNEAAWLRRLGGESCGYDRRALKVAVYGMERAALEVQRKQAEAAALRLGQNLALLEQLFPIGFGAFAWSVRSW